MRGREKVQHFDTLRIQVKISFVGSNPHFVKMSLFFAMLFFEFLGIAFVHFNISCGFNVNIMLSSSSSSSSSTQKIAPTIQSNWMWITELDTGSVILLQVNMNAQQYSCFWYWIIWSLFTRIRIQCKQRQNITTTHIKRSQQKLQAICFAAASNTHTGQQINKQHRKDTRTFPLSPSWNISNIWTLRKSKKEIRYSTEKNESGSFIQFSE